MRTQPLVVAFDVAREPVGVGLGPDQEEERLGPDGGLGLRGEVPQDQVLEAAVATASHDLGAEPHLDVVGRLDLVGPGSPTCRRATTRPGSRG